MQAPKGKSHLRVPCKGEKAIYTRHASAQASTKRAKKNTVSPEKKLYVVQNYRVNEGTNLDPLTSGLDALTT
jgi:hypothetical protein